MPDPSTTLIVGEDCTLTIGTTAYNHQIESYTLETESESETYQTLAGPVAKKLSEATTLTLTVFSDWGATPSLCDALWTAAEAGQSVAFEAVVDGAIKFTGNVVAVKPPVLAEAGAASSVDIELPVDGPVTKAAVPVAP